MQHKFIERQVVNVVKISRRLTASWTFSPILRRLLASGYCDIIKLSRNSRQACSLSVVVVLSLLFAWTCAKPSAAVDAPPAPKVSTFAPAEDLVRQADKYLKSLKDTVACEEDYKVSEGKINRDSSTLVVILLALGLHDEDNKYKSAAPAMMKAAQQVAATKDFAASKKAVEALEAVAAKPDKSTGELKWEPVASLPDLMKQVPMVNTKLKMAMKGKNFQKKASLSQGHAAVIAAIAQGTMFDASEAKNAEQAKQWQKFSAAMRDDAASVGAAIRKADEPAAAEAMKKLNQSCEDCHVVFKPDIVSAADGL